MQPSLQLEELAQLLISAPKVLQEEAIIEIAKHTHLLEKKGLVLRNLLQHLIQDMLRVQELNHQMEAQNKNLMAQHEKVQRALHRERAMVLELRLQFETQRMLLASGQQNGSEARDSPHWETQAAAPRNGRTLDPDPHIWALNGEPLQIPLPGFVRRLSRSTAGSQTSRVTVTLSSDLRHSPSVPTAPTTNFSGEGASPVVMQGDNLASSVLTDAASSGDSDRNSASAVSTRSRQQLPLQMRAILQQHLDSSVLLQQPQQEGHQLLSFSEFAPIRAEVRSLPVGAPAA